jgi:5-formyltetrahydrofolate cyclo-ligase
MDLAPVKQALRDQIRARILAMNAEVRMREERILLARLADLPGFREASTVLLYASVFPEEFDTSTMLRLALDLGKRLICPRVVRGEGRLALHEIRSTTLDFRPGTRGIPEPAADRPELQAEEIDWALVPGLGYDPRCYRIGRGAGHYDRLLPTLRPDAPRWSLCLTSQWEPELPVEPHDQPLDGVADAERIVTRP